MSINDLMMISKADEDAARWDAINATLAANVQVSIDNCYKLAKNGHIIDSPAFHRLLTKEIEFIYNQAGFAVEVDITPHTKYRGCYLCNIEADNSDVITNIFLILDPFKASITSAKIGGLNETTETTENT